MDGAASTLNEDFVPPASLVWLGARGGQNYVQRLTIFGRWFLVFRGTNLRTFYGWFVVCGRSVHFT